MLIKQGIIPAGIMKKIQKKLVKVFYSVYIKMASAVAMMTGLPL